MKKKKIDQAVKEKRESPAFHRIEATSQHMRSRRKFPAASGQIDPHANIEQSLHTLSTGIGTLLASLDFSRWPEWREVSLENPFSVCAPFWQCRIGCENAWYLSTFSPNQRTSLTSEEFTPALCSCLPSPLLAIHHFV